MKTNAFPNNQGVKEKEIRKYFQGNENTMYQDSVCVWGLGGGGGTAKAA